MNERGDAAAVVDGAAAPQSAEAGRTLAVAGTAHALHDGYTDLIYILLPVWQTEFALGYGMLALLRGLYAGTMAAFQVPVGRLVEKRDGRIVLALDTVLAGVGHALAGSSGGLAGLCAGLVLSGAGAPARSIRSLRPPSRALMARTRAVRSASIILPAISAKPQFLL